VLGVTRGGYYAWRSRSRSARDLADQQLLTRIRRIYDDSRQTYAAPRVLAMLRREGVRTSKRRVTRLMRLAGMQGVTRAKKYRAKTRKQLVRPDYSLDLVRREFHAEAPNRLWFADITYVKTYQGWLFLAVVFDIYSRMVVGWSMASKMTADLVDNALRMAIARRNPPSGLIHHSDHGSQYCSLLLGSTMRPRGIRPSMGSIASPWNNAVTESLMSTIKMECVHPFIFKTREEAKLEIIDYTERFYNRVKIHSNLGDLSPLEYEQQQLQTVN
ncbi:IS3 family transposase, partial [Mobiluncus porci]